MLPLSHRARYSPPILQTATPVHAVADADLVAPQRKHLETEQLQVAAAAVAGITLRIPSRVEAAAAAATTTTAGVRA
jgi:hypothetical protein